MRGRDHEKLSCRICATPPACLALTDLSDPSGEADFDRPRARGRLIRGGIVATTDTATYNGYCVKCKEKRDYTGKVEISKTGMRMAKGPCPVCGTTVNRILGKA